MLKHGRQALEHLGRYAVTKAGHEGTKYLKRKVDDYIHKHKNQRPMKRHHGHNRDTVHNNSLNHPDKVLDTTHPAEETFYKQRLSKATRRRQKKIKRFVKKVQRAVERPQRHSLWVENTITNDRVVSFSGTTGAIDHQDQSSTGLLSELMLHPASLNINVNGFVTYPYAAITLAATDPNIIATGGVGSTEIVVNPIDVIKVKTTVARMQLNLKNVHATATIFVDIYTFIAKQDSVNNAWATPVKAWNQASTLATTALPRPSELDFASANYTGFADETTKGSTPLDFPVFGEYWKQETKTTLEMGPGIMMTWNFPKARKGTFDTQMCFNKYTIKGHTQAAMINVRVNHTSITNGAALLNYEVNKQYHYKMCGSDKTPFGNLTAADTYIAA